MAKLDVNSDKDSWGRALVRIKRFCDEEIKAIYSDVFGIDREFDNLLVVYIYLIIID